MTDNERYKRTNETFSQDDIRKHVYIVGCGSIGSVAAEYLARIGVQQFTLYDNDDVETHNIATQGFDECDIGMPKVDLVDRNICRINESAQVTAINEKWSSSCPDWSMGDVVFSCVDSIDTRKRLFAKWKISDSRIFLDARMSAKTCQIYCIDRYRKDSVDMYQSSLFPAEQTQGDRCTQQSTIFCSAIAAGMMVGMYIDACSMAQIKDFVWLDLNTYGFLS